MCGERFPEYCETSSSDILPTISSGRLSLATISAFVKFVFCIAQIFINGAKASASVKGKRGGKEVYHAVFSKIPSTLPKIFRKMSQCLK